jgi:heavy metal translocating P-type ATPase
MAVHGNYETSTYQKIIDLVEEGQKHQPGFIKLADKYNYAFTAFTGVVASIAFGFTGELERVLAVLVVATPCPLLIAAPTSFIAGVGKMAKQGIIVKRANALEVVTKVKKIFFDKTGTLTLGTPQFVKVESDLDENEILEIAGALEIHSLHPLAKSLVQEVENRGLKNLSSEEIEEHLGKGICGFVQGNHYCILSDPDKGDEGIVLALTRDSHEIAELYFDDVMKEDSQKVVKDLRKRGLELVMVTGDKRANAQRLFGDFGITIHAECSPEQKFDLVTKAQRDGQMVALVGDGLNDAPAIAEADLGVVFSHSENTAAVEAAEFVLVKPDLSSILSMIDISARSIRIARQSIWIGMSLSCTAMIVAAFGYIPPSVGAFVQEAIDVSVILYALRSAR